MRTPLLVLVYVFVFAAGPALGQSMADTQAKALLCTNVTTVDTGGSIPAQGAIGGVAVDHAGRIYVATFRDAVYRVELDGTRILLNNDFGNASGNTIANNGDLLQSDYERDELFRVHEDGTRTLIATGLARPVGVIMDANDDVFVVNYGDDTISHVSPSGHVSLFSNSSLLNGPNGIVLSDTGVMYVVNFKDNLLLRIAQDGTAEIVAAIPGRNNAHVAWHRGRLYVSTILTDQVYEVTPGGRVRLLAGTGQRGMEDGCAPDDATLSYPNGIAAAPNANVLYTNNFVGIMGGPGGRIYVRAINLQ